MILRTVEAKRKTFFIIYHYKHFLFFEEKTKKNGF